GVGKASATSMSAGIFTHTTEGLRKDELIQATIDIGRNINDDRLVRKLVTEGGGVLGFMDEIRANYDLKSSGVQLRRRKLVFPGIEMMMLMKDLLSDMGVTFLERCITSKLAVENNKCVGTLCWEKSGRLLSVASTSTVLATGGFCAIYEDHDNPVGAVGDGIAMALEAGAQARDMEFVQFFPIGMKQEGLPRFVLFPPYPEGAMIVNDKGDDVLRKRIPDEADLTRAVLLKRDRVCQAIAFEEERGRRCYLDLSNVEDWDAVDITTMNSLYQLRKYGFPRSDNRIRIGPTAHHSMGGVIIDDRCRTGVDGLFAAGEVTGGLHGANRRGGNALTEALVFGRIAGRMSAENASRTRRGKTYELQNPNDEIEIDSSKIARMRRNCAVACSKCLGIIRSRDALAEGKEKIKSIRQELRTILGGVGPYGKLRELDSALLVAEGAMSSALLRQESRGSHFRKDFPVEDDRWIGFVRVSMSAGGLSYSFVSKAPGS
ncbi:MAG: FAD-binding protein, partial [Methanomassiliicoccales archaeon]|nr:FAD-binding protein [Methanomassiliicoccales archaeon]